MKVKINRITRFSHTKDTDTDSYTDYFFDPRRTDLKQLDSLSLNKKPEVNRI